MDRISKNMKENAAKQAAKEKKIQKKLTAKRGKAPHPLEVKVKSTFANDKVGKAIDKESATGGNTGNKK